MPLCQVYFLLTVAPGRGRYENTPGYSVEDVLNINFKEEAKECGSFDKFVVLLKSF